MKLNKLFITMAVVSAAAFSTSTASAQESATPASEPIMFEQPGDRALMTRVILRNLTIWVRPADGTRIYSRSCRTMRHGCERQISTLVDYIFEESQRQGFDPWLLAAVAWHESRFNPFAASSAGAYGILQFLRRSPWSRGLSFVRQRWYRERCRRELGACQRPIVERSIYWIQRSAAHCGSLSGGLRMYNSGRCDGPRRYPRAIFAYKRQFLEMAAEIRANDFIDPASPQDGPIYVADEGPDCAEPTLEEHLCEQGSGPCTGTGIRAACIAQAAEERP